VSRSTVIIVSSPNDIHARVVARRIADAGARAVILDSGEFPRRWRVSLRLGEGPPRYVLGDGEADYPAEDVRGVWYRRPRAHLPDPAIADAEDRRHVVEESREAFLGWLATLGRKVINPPASEAVAARKVYQLAAARAAGLRVPETLVSNDPESVRQFCAALGRRVVFKPFLGPRTCFVATQRLGPAHFAALDKIRHAPGIFQEEISKVADLRATVVDGEIFVAMVRSRGREVPLDTRLDPEPDYTACKLPDAVAAALRRLVAALGLRFGAADFGVTAGGEHVFFEINPGGQWLFVEIATGMRISHAMARALLAEEPGVAETATTGGPQRVQVE
jgi:glutathione synthase/RimK-type ligase-like ATP-grasp enzyme